MSDANRNVMTAVLLLGALSSVWALELPWQKAGRQETAGAAPAPRLSIPGAGRDDSPPVGPEYVGGQTIHIGTLTVTVPAGWYRGEKADEDECRAYMFMYMPSGSEDPGCVVDIDYNPNELEEGAARVPGFLREVREMLLQDGEWEEQPVKIAGRDTQCFRKLTADNDTRLMVQPVLRTCVPNIYVIVPAKNATLPAEAVAFIAGIKQR